MRFPPGAPLGAPAAFLRGRVFIKKKKRRVNPSNTPRAPKDIKWRMLAQARGEPVGRIPHGRQRRFFLPPPKRHQFFTVNECCIVNKDLAVHPMATCVSGPWADRGYPIPFCATAGRIGGAGRTGNLARGEDDCKAGCALIPSMNRRGAEPEGGKKQ